MTHRSPPHLSPRAARVGMPLWRNPLPPSICLAPAVETASGETGRWPADAEPIGDLLYRARRLAHAADLAELDDLLSSVERAYVDGRISAEDRLALLAVHGRVFRQLSARASLNLRSARMLARS